MTHMTPRAADHRALVALCAALVYRAAGPGRCSRRPLPLDELCAQHRNAEHLNGRRYPRFEEPRQ